MAKTYNVSLDQYATYVLVVTWAPGGVLVNLTGYTAALTVVQSNLNPRPIILALSQTATSLGSAIVLGGAGGTITITVTATETAALRPGTYAYDLLLTSAGGVATRLIEGSFTVTPGVTP